MTTNETFEMFAENILASGERVVAREKAGEITPEAAQDVEDYILAAYSLCHFVMEEMEKKCVRMKKEQDRLIFGGIIPG